MRRLASIITAALLAASCSNLSADEETEITLQRIFGTCEGEYGGSADVENADGECGIITTLINKFQAQNPGIRVRVQTVFWPGYDQLTAQLAANDEPDLVTMHASVIPDYQARNLLEPLGDDLRSAGIDPAQFTEAARRSVTIGGTIYGLPFDTWAPLWHINLGEFRKAGLVRQGKPILPNSAEELFDHAERFRRATGKPYFVQTMANEYASFARNLYTGLVQQGSTVFPDPRHIHLTTPEARRVLSLYREIYTRGHTTKNLDYSAATASFLNGGGGVFLTGTWMVSTFDKEAKTPGKPLSGGYAVVPYPNLFGAQNRWFVDGHNWVMPRDPDRTAQEKQAALRLMRFLIEHNGDWARTGHLPVIRQVLDNPSFQALPHRSSYLEIARKGVPLPSTVRRQYPIENILGEESAAAITGQKPIDRALRDAEARVNELLDNI